MEIIVFDELDNFYIDSFNEKIDLNINKLSESLQLYKEVEQQYIEYEKLLKKLSDNIEKIMKQFKWKNYSDKKSKVNVSFLNVKRKRIDEKKLKKILNEDDYVSVINVTSKQDIKISTPQKKKTLNKMVK